MASDLERTIALAGLMQSCLQVRAIARTGNWQTTDVKPCIHSLFQIKASDVEAVYGSYSALKPGLIHLQKILQRKIDRSDVEISRYSASLLSIERRLKNNAYLLNKIREGLYNISHELDSEDLDNNTLFSRIAGLYVDTISTIPPRIQVMGEEGYLSRMENTWRVRSLLFCGLRSAVLWRQLGGSRWHLFFRRKRIMRCIDALL